MLKKKKKNDERRNYLLLEPNLWINWLLKCIILDFKKISMYEFWYDYIKPKYGDNVYIKKKTDTAWADKDSIYHNVKLKDYYLLERIKKL